MGKEKKEYGLTKEDFFEILKLAIPEGNIDDVSIEIETYDLSKLKEDQWPLFMARMNISRKEIRNKEIKRFKATIPISKGKPWMYFEFFLYPDGFISYENGSGIMMRYENPIAINKILIKAGFPHI